MQWYRGFSVFTLPYYDHGRRGSPQIAVQVCYARGRDCDSNRSSRIWFFEPEAL